MSKTTPKTRSEPAQRRVHLFDATAEPPATASHPRAVLRWLLDVAARRGVGHRATRLLCALDAHADDGGACYPSIATLARLLGIADPNSTHVYGDLSELEDAGLVEKRRDGRRLVRRVLRPAAYVQNGRTDTSESDVRHVRNGRTDTSESDAGSTQPKTQTKSTPKTQRGSGSSASLGSGRVESDDDTSERPASTRRMKNVRERAAHLGNGATADELVEACRALGIRSLGRVKQRIKERGIPWMRDLLAASKTAPVPRAFVLKFLSRPDEFERPEGVPYDKPAPERYGGDLDYDGTRRRRTARRRVTDDGDGIRDVLDLVDADEPADEDDHD